MLEKKTTTIEFLGGPLDGYRWQERRYRPATFALVRTPVVIPHGGKKLASLRHWLRRMTFRRQSPSYLVAVYELFEIPGESIYEHVSSHIETTNRMHALIELVDAEPQW